jgi:hypothetical protein
MNTDVTKRLQAWYSAACDGSWEHQHGVHIDTLDNPGWAVRIAVEGTNLEGKGFVAVAIDRSEDDWVRCEVKGGLFEGVGGATNLTEILDIFLRWSGG